MSPPLRARVYTAPWSRYPPAMQGVFHSVIIPVLHEAASIAALVAHIRSLPAPGPVEIVVVDGAPGADTLAALDVVNGPDLLLVPSPAGRAGQMNLGALASHGEILVFLHADTTLPHEAFSLIAETLADPAVAGGAFDLEFGPQATPGQRWIARRANSRSRRTRVPYGDQAIFLRRTVFRSLGGFAPLPLMEDLAFMVRLRTAGYAIRILDAPVTTSPRRWQREGTALCTARNLLIRGLYHLGLPPAWLAPLYRFDRPNALPRAAKDIPHD